VSFPGALPGLEPDGVHEVELDAASADEALLAAREAGDALASGTRLRIRASVRALAAAGHPLLAEAAAAIAAHASRPPLLLRGEAPLAPAPGGRAAILGVVNVTPDSFSDGGLRLDPRAALESALAMAAAGADVIDVGGESTRPGSEPVSAEEEMKRVLPVVEALARAGTVPISIDTSKAKVAEAAIAAGASIVNDVTALAGDPDMAATVARAGVPAILMHARGTPRDMQRSPEYPDGVVETVARALREALLRAARAGLRESLLWVDPGFGFGKTREHNFAILRRLHELRSLGRPVVSGTSRKTMLARPGSVRDLRDVPDAPRERLLASVASATAAALAGAAIVRVHDVAETAEALRVAALVRGERP